MNADATLPLDDPLCGNSISGLLDCALGTPLPLSRLGAGDLWVPPAPEHIAVLLPQYRIEGLIGRGGMGAVYKGSQITLNRPVAIKVLPAELARNAEFLARFHREAQLLASLSHQNIVTIFEFGQTTEGHLYFVMEYVDGTDLHRLIHQSKLEAAQALRLTIQICEAMQYAHDMGVIHRDIKPANVLVTPDGRAKLADFGLAAKPSEMPLDLPQPEAFEPNDPLGVFALRLTRPGTGMGTPDYAAPEVYEGKADARSDIYALGIMLYEMLTGAPPRGYYALPSSQAGVDARVDSIVGKALEADPAARYQKASDMKLAVEEASTPLPATSPAHVPQPSPAVARPPSRGHLHKWAWIAAAVLLLAGGVVVYESRARDDGKSLASAPPPLPAPAPVVVSTPVEKPPTLPPAPVATPVLSAPASTALTAYDDLAAFEKMLRSYTWVITGKDWVIQFRDNHVAPMKEGKANMSYHWWIIGQRTLHIQFAAMPAKYDPNIGGTWIFDPTMTSFKGDKGMHLGVRGRPVGDRPTGQGR